MKPTATKLSALALLLCAASQFAHAQITTTPSSLANFTTTVGNASTAQTLSINATGPLGAIIVTAPTGFEISTNATTGFTPSITLGIPGGRVQSVYRGSSATHTGMVWDNGSGSEFPNLDAFAAITSNGSVVTWGYVSNGGSSEVIVNLYDGPNSFSPTPIRSVAENLNSNVTALYSNENAFAALKTNGSVIAWGNVDNGGNSTVVLSNTVNGTESIEETSSVTTSLNSNVTNIFSNREAFAALKNDGSVVTWGDTLHGGNSTITTANYTYTSNATSIVTNELNSVSEFIDSNVVNIFSSERAFAALKQDGSVVTWGDSWYGGNSTRYEQVWDELDRGFSSEINVASELSSGVIDIYPSAQSFAALKSDGSVVIWGQNYVRGSAENLTANLSANITAVYYNSQAFAAVRKNGSVVTWGRMEYGGNATIVFSNRVDGYWSNLEGDSVADQLTSDVQYIYSNLEAFAALKNDGSVVTWGNVSYGGNSSVIVTNTVNGIETVSEVSSAADDLKNNVTRIYSNTGAFAALKTDGSVVTWGDSLRGGNSSNVSHLLNSNVAAIYSNENAFAALKTDGSVVAWGDVNTGGNLTRVDYPEDSDTLTEMESVVSQLTSGVIEIYANSRSFAALKSDGSVVAWGHNSGGTGAPSNIGASTSGLPAQIYVRLASTGNAQTVNGDLVISSLNNADESSVEIGSLPLSGTITSGSSGFTGSSDNSGGGGSGGSISGGGGGGLAEVKKAKKGSGKSLSAKKSKGSKKSAAKTSGSKSSSGKKSGGKKAKKK